MPPSPSLDKPLIYDQIAGDDGMSPALRLVFDLVPPGSRVLDVGCASGYFSEVLVQRRGCTVVGLDYSESAVRVARQRGIDARVIDLDHQKLDATGFDVVVFADVLEHVRDPLSVLRQAGGASRAIVSVPNIANWTARRELLRGRFPLNDFGLFDRTHLRFFTCATADQLVADSGWKPVERRYVPGPIPMPQRIRGMHRVAAAATRIRPQLFAWQFVMAAERGT